MIGTGIRHEKARYGARFRDMRADNCRGHTHTHTHERPQFGLVGRRRGGDASVDLLNDHSTTVVVGELSARNSQMRARRELSDKALCNNDYGKNVVRKF